jgi:hypothetical protein
MGYMGYVHLLLGVIYPLLVQLAWGSDGYMSLNIGSDEKKVFVNTKKRKKGAYISIDIFLLLGYRDDESMLSAQLTR